MSQTPYNVETDNRFLGIEDLASSYVIVGNSAGKATDVAMSGDTTISNTGVVTIGAGKVLETMLAVPTTDGLNAKRTARATYDFAVDGGAISTIGSGVTLPDNAVVTRAWYDVITTFTSSTDAATIAINIPTDGDLQAATAISAGGNVYDAGLHDCATKGDDPGDPSTYIKLTDAREISWVIAVEAVTAGKLVLFVEYVVSS